MPPVIILLWPRFAHIANKMDREIVVLDDRMYCRHFQGGPLIEIDLCDMNRCFSADDFLGADKLLNDAIEKAVTTEETINA